MKHSHRFPIDIIDPFYTLITSEPEFFTTCDRDEIADRIAETVALWKADRRSGSWQVFRSAKDEFTRDVSHEFFEDDDLPEYAGYDRECSAADRLYDERRA